MLKEIARGKSLNAEELQEVKGGRIQDIGSCGTYACSNCGTRSGSQSQMDWDYGVWFWS